MPLGNPAGYFAQSPADLLRRQIALQLLGPRAAPGNVGEGLASIGQSLAGALTGRAMIGAAEEEDAAGRQAVIDLLAGRQPQLDPGVAALDINRVQGPAFTPGRPGLGQLAGITPEQAQALMLVPGGMERLMELALPEPISPVEKERLELQRQGLGLEREGLDLRREQFASEQEFQRAKLAQAGAEAAPKITDVRNARLDYLDSSAPWETTRDAFEKITTSLGRGTAAGDMAGIFSFMKALDPTSTVREGEYASAQNTTGIPGYILNLYNQAVDGTLLSPQQRQEFMTISGDFLAQQRDRQLIREQIHRRQAELAGIDPERVVPDLIGRYRDFAPEPPSRAEPAPPLPRSLPEIPGDISRRLPGALEEAGEALNRAVEPTLGSRETASAPVKIDTLPPVNERAVGQVYELPSGSRVRWQPGGWERVQ